MEPRPSWWANIFGGLIGIGLLLGPPPAAIAGSVSLAWDSNTEPDLAGYQLYYRQSSGNYQFFVDVGNQTTYILSGLTDGQTYYFAVTAYDTSGNESNFSTEVSTTVSGSGPPPDTILPTVSITSPTSNPTYSTGSSPLALGGTASDNVGVTQVRWANDRGGSGTASGTTGWTASGIVLQAGMNLLTVTARDAAGNTATDTLTVTYTPPDTTPPTVSITAPANNATVFGPSVTVSANASDNVGVIGVQFRLDGVNLGPEDTTPPYSVSWDTTTATSGGHTLTARARDAAGNTTTSSNVKVTVDNGTTASLTVQTLPGSQIFLGGNYAYLGVFQGTVPETGQLQISELLPGRHILRTSAAGFMDAYRILNLSPGSNMLTLNLALFDPVVTLNPTFNVLEAGGPILGGGGASVPFVVDWDNDDNKDLLLAGGDGSIALYLNVGSDAAPQFLESTPIMADGVAIAVPGPSFPFVVDWDDDGNKDLIVGDGQGRVRWYRNTLTDATPQLVESGFLQAGGGDILVASPASPFVVDWNSDGKKDLLVGDGAGMLRVFVNQGTDANPVLAAGVTISLPDVGVIRANARAFVGDWNQDAQKDLLVGYENGGIYVFLNSGTDSAPVFTTGSPLIGQGTPVVVSSQAAPFVVDWDSDGLRDLVIGSNDGEVFLVQGSEPGATGGNGSGEGGAADGSKACFIATAAYGSPLAPQVQILRELRDRYLLPNPAGHAFVRLYYKLSPPLAEVIAGSEILRAIVRGGLAPILGWAALILWTPRLALGILMVVIGLWAWFALRGDPRRRWWFAHPAGPLTWQRTRSGRSRMRRRLAIWACILFILATAALVEASQGDRLPAGAHVQLVAEVRLHQVKRFALIRDDETGQVGLYKRDESIHAGDNPLPLGRIVAVQNEVLVLALLNGRTIEIRQGARLPGPRRLIFVRSALVDTLRYQVRFERTATPSNFSVVDILGRRAILQRDANPGGGQIGLAAAPVSRQAPNRANALADMLNQIPLDEVGPDTWEVPAWAVKEIGGHLGPVVREALGSARPSFTKGYGIALRIDTSLGAGTLDRRGFLIQYAKLARRMGLEVGDRILFVNDQPVVSAGGLFRIYRKLNADASLSEIRVIINRGNQLRTLTYRVR